MCMHRPAAQTCSQHYQPVIRRQHARRWLECQCHVAFPASPRICLYRTRTEIYHKFRASEFYQTDTNFGTLHSRNSHSRRTAILCGAPDELLFDDLPGASWAEQQEYLEDRCMRPQLNILHVLGTQDTWQGKLTVRIQRGKTERHMLKLSIWPLQLVLQACDVPTLYRLSATCTDLESPAFTVIEQRAHDDAQRLFFDDSRRMKFLDLFGYYTWAQELQRMLTVNTLVNLDEDELNVMYDIAAVPQNLHLKCLSPQAIDHWQKLGRCAFQDFFRGCIAARGSMRKQLSLFKRAWAALEEIFKLNANEQIFSKYPSSSQRLRHVGASVGERRLRGYLAHQVTASWPNVRVLVMSENVCETHTFSFCS